MIFKNTYLIPTDKNGVLWVKTFHLYKGSSGKTAYLGDFIKCSVKKTKPKNWLLKKTKIKGIIIRTKKEVFKKDGSWLKFKNNNVVLLKKRMNSFGKCLLGPAVFNIRRKKFLNSFSGIL